MGTIMTDEERQAWLAIRKEAGLKVDPKTAEVEWTSALTLDPYGVWPELPEEYQQVGREYFGRSPGSDVWVNFHDLPEATRDALWKKHRRKLAFPGVLKRCLQPRRDGKVSRSSMSNTEHRFADPNRHLVEVPDRFAVARWSRDADVATIARCILGTLKYEPHTADTTALRRALEGVIEQNGTSRAQPSRRAVS